jgi:hypothetical protein
LFETILDEIESVFEIERGSLDGGFATTPGFTYLDQVP